MAILKKIYPCIVSLLLTSCYEDFNPDINIEPKLCINSLITAGEPIEVKVSHTWLYTDPTSENDHSVDDASVTIYVNGTAQAEDYIAQEGDEIRIVAKSNLYGEAEATVTVPVSTPIAHVKCTPRVTNVYSLNIPRAENDYDIVSQYADITFDILIELTIEDKSATDKYFHYDCIGYHKGTEPDDAFGNPIISSNFYLGTFIYEAEPIFAEHIGLLESISGMDAWGFTFFTNRQFTGKSYTLNLRYTSANVSVNTIGDINDAMDFEMELYLSSVSMSYYNWANYEWQMDSGLIGDLGNIGFCDPVWGYSNVSTGAGVVAAQSLSTYTLNLHDYLYDALMEHVESNKLLKYTNDR